jgi:hypothetical protein
LSPELKYVWNLRRCYQFNQKDQVMDIIVITLVTTMSINGMDYDRHDKMGSLSECWERAQAKMTEMLAMKDHPATNIGIGCVVGLADPA